MRKLLLAAFGVFAVSGIASAQQPQFQMTAPQSANQPVQAPVYQPVQAQVYQPAQAPTYPPGAVAATPIQPTAGATVISGNGGYSNCGPKASTGLGSKLSQCTVANVTGGNCPYGYNCQNGCGSVKSTLAFQFGTCSQFFSPCGPTCGGLWKKCGTTAFAQPYGMGWQCPRQYDTYANH